MADTGREVLRLASLKPELQRTKPSFLVSFAVATLGTLASSELNPMMVLHNISGSKEPLSPQWMNPSRHPPSAGV